MGRIRSWMRGTRDYLVERPVRLAVVGGAFLAGVGVGIPASDNAYDYTWTSPYFCNDCHVHDYADEAYFRSVHAGVTTCHDCHLVPIIHYPRNLWKMVADRPQTADDIHNPHVDSVLCEACHTEQEEVHLTGPMTDELRARVVKIDDSPLHRVHLDAEHRTPGPYLGGQEDTDAPEAEHDGGHGATDGPIACMDCHGSGGNEAAHRFTAERENCLECHGGLDVHTGRLGQLRCQECHFQGFTGK